MRLGRLRFGLLPPAGGRRRGSLALGMASTVPARADEPLIHYNGNSRDYWVHPPADWFMGDETAQQHGDASLSGAAAADAA